jgi:hypothetical protein
LTHVYQTDETSVDNTVKLWRLLSDNSSATCVDTLQGDSRRFYSVSFKVHIDFVLCVAFHPTAPLLATGKNNCTCQRRNSGAAAPWIGPIRSSLLRMHADGVRWFIPELVQTNSNPANALYTLTPSMRGKSAYMQCKALNTTAKAHALLISKNDANCAAIKAKRLAQKNANLTASPKKKSRRSRATISKLEAKVLAPFAPPTERAFTKQVHTKRLPTNPDRAAKFAPCVNGGWCRNHCQK